MAGYEKLASGQGPLRAADISKNPGDRKRKRASSSFSEDVEARNKRHEQAANHQGRDDIEVLADAELDFYESEVGDLAICAASRTLANPILLVQDQGNVTEAAFADRQATLIHLGAKVLHTRARCHLGEVVQETSEYRALATTDNPQSGHVSLHKVQDRAIFCRSTCRTQIDLFASGH